MNEPTARTNCGKWQKCGAIKDECYIHSLASRPAALHAVAFSGCRFTWTADSLYSGAWIWPWSGFSTGWRGQLPPVHGSRRHIDDIIVYLRVLRHRPAVGPPVRVSE